MPKNNTISWRLKQVENNLNVLDARVDKLLQNDIPDIQEELSGLRTRVNVLTAVNVGAIILAVLVNKFL